MTATSTINNRAEILIVEDSPTQAEQLRYLLERSGYGVVTADDGVEALRLIQERPPTLVVSDVVMPGMDGYTLCRQIKSHERLKNMPVLLVTSLSSPRDIVRGLECGANMFIRKPFEERYFLSRIEYALTNLEIRKRETLQLGIELNLAGQRHFITSDRQQILDLLISTYGEAVRIHEELQARQEELLRSNRIVNGLLHIAEALNQAKDEEGLIAAVLERALGLPGVRAGWIVLLDDDSMFRVAGSRGLPPALARPGAFEDPCSCQRKLLSGELTSLPCMVTCERLKSAKEEDSQELHCHASLPIRLGEQPVGIINLLGAGEGLFTSEELKILHGVSQEFSVALERARLLAQLENKVADRTAALTAEIARRERIEQELRASEERYRDLVENANDVVFALDLDGNITSFNRAGEFITGYSAAQVSRMKLQDLLAAESAPAARQMMEHHRSGAESVRCELELCSASGSRATLEVNSRSSIRDGKLNAIHAIARDITTSRQLKERLQQAERLEAIGRLAAGVAHDFNNLLGVVKGYADLLLMDSRLGPDAGARLEAILKAADRGAELNRQLLAFGRKQVLEPRPLNLNTVVSESARVLPRLLGEDIRLSLRLLDGLGRVNVDPTQVEQVLLNLVANARDAMPRGGQITVETDNVNLDERYATEHPVVSPGRYVMLRVTDTGLGMDRETRRRIFEPFFTTKPRDKGTGLGLASVYGIVKQSGGYVWVYSEPGQGTTFRIYFPRIEDPASEAKARGVPAATIGGTETILLVEDNEALRELTRELLKGLGYEVLDAGEGEGALEIAERRGETIHLLLTDVVLPRVSGPALAAQLQSRCPGLKTLYMSGYAEDAMTDRGVLAPGTMLLQKPFTRRTLAQRVREALS